MRARSGFTIDSADEVYCILCIKDAINRKLRLRFRHLVGGILSGVFAASDLNPIAAKWSCWVDDTTYQPTVSISSWASIIFLGPLRRSTFVPNYGF
jgi:hypothetical protein